MHGPPFEARCTNVHRAAQGDGSEVLRIGEEIYGFKISFARSTTLFGVA